jgi:hypothetical protein
MKITKRLSHENLSPEVSSYFDKIKTGALHERPVTWQPSQIFFRTQRKAKKMFDKMENLSYFHAFVHSIEMDTDLAVNGKMCSVGPVLTTTRRNLIEAR